MPQLDFKKNSNSSSRYNDARDSFASSEASIISSYAKGKAKNNHDPNTHTFGNQNAQQQADNKIGLKPEIP